MINGNRFPAPSPGDESALRYPISAESGMKAHFAPPGVPRVPRLAKGWGLPHLNFAG
jgi:hypothetical protein